MDQKRPAGGGTTASVPPLALELGAIFDHMFQARSGFPVASVRLSGPEQLRRRRGGSRVVGAAARGHALESISKPRSKTMRQAVLNCQVRLSRVDRTDAPIVRAACADGAEDYPFGP
jgi:hypothetical protein